ncbi:unnamed protein product [Agarophyton chilense]
MQQPNRPARAGRSARAHSKHHSAPSADSAAVNASDSHTASELAPNDVPHTSARHPLPPATLRSRRPYPRHRKSKNRSEHQPHLAPTPAATSASEQPPCNTLTVHSNPVAHQHLQPTSSAHPSSAPLITTVENSVLISQPSQISPPDATNPSISQIASELQSHSPPRASAHQSPVSSAAQPSQQAARSSAIQTSQPEQQKVAHQPSIRDLAQQVVKPGMETKTHCHQVSLPMQTPNTIALQHISFPQPALPPQRQLRQGAGESPPLPIVSPTSQPIATGVHVHTGPAVVQSPFCPAPGEALLKPDTNAVTVTSHTIPNQGQSLQLAIPSRVERSASSNNSQQSFVFTRAVNVSSSTVPYQLVSPSPNPQCQHLISGGASQGRKGRLKGDVPVVAEISSGSPVGHTAAGSSCSKEKNCPAKESDPREEDKIAELVSRIKASIDGPRVRPLICQDITSSNADTLRISRLPRGVTYDRLYSMVEPFGEVEELAWSATDPYVCEVTYRDPAAAHEAKHFLGDALVGSDTEPPLKAELHSRDPGAQLFVGDLTPDVTEEMLEDTFSKLVGEPVTALLKRDPDSFSPIGYGFLSFRSESSANFALVAGHRAKIGNACVRVGRAERNTYLYVSDLSPNVSMSELKDLFGRFGSLVDEDTVIIRRSYAFVRYKNRNAAEKAKRTLDKTDLKGRLSVRYAEAEPLKACVAVQFHSSVPRPPNSLRDLLTATFSKHGNCSVEIPRLSNGMWRKVAFVTFHGDPMAANLAALEAVQSIRFVSSLPVCCQFARELIPRLPSKGLAVDRLAEAHVTKSNLTVPSERVTAKLFHSKKNSSRRSDHIASASKGISRGGQINLENLGNEFLNDKQGRGPNFVPIYVPITALQHPTSQIPPGSIIGADSTSNPYQWPGRLLVPGGASGEPMGHPSPNMNSTYNSFGRMPEPRMKW